MALIALIVELIKSQQKK
ncbi:hypothetical protein [Lactiplantibacillus argentoratensis]